MKLTKKLISASLDVVLKDLEELAKRDAPEDYDILLIVALQHERINKLTLSGLQLAPLISVGGLLKSCIVNGLYIGFKLGLQVSETESFESLFKGTSDAN